MTNENFQALKHLIQENETLVLAWFVYLQCSAYSRPSLFKLSFPPLLLSLAPLSLAGIKAASLLWVVTL